jgi:succinate dehydrogenase hydrophobic anchor subunit
MDPMIPAPPTSKARLAWLVQTASGLLLLLLLCLHMIANHFVVPGGLQGYADVVRYLSNPLILTLEMTFLVAVTGHAALGVRAILLDLGLSQRAGRNVSLVIGALSVVAVAYGTWLTSRVIGGLG